MRAVGVREFGGPEALEVVDVPEVHAGPGEVRIRVYAATVNPTDTYHRTGSRAKMLAADPPPYIPGMDVAGVADEVGDGVTGIAVGDRVMGVVLPKGNHGGYREQIVLKECAVVRAPQGSTHAEAATLPMNGLTARLGLDLLALQPGDWLAVTGAAGAYGGLTVQMAKADGLQVIADASEADEAMVAALGADIVVRRGDDVAERIRAALPDGVHGGADGSVQGDLLIPAVRDGGRIATVRGYRGPEVRGITWYPVLVSKYMEDRAALDRIRVQAEAGVLAMRVARTFPPHEAPAAHRTLEAGGTRGRLIIEFPD
jgi:NADPH2:quinone reductase